MTDREERRRLLFADLAATGSTETRNELVESYAPLAEYFANRYKGRSGDHEDLRQVAHLALVKAVDRFDPERGVGFSTFAGRTIDGELKRYFRDKTWSVRVPRSLQEAALEVRAAVDRLSTERGKSPTVDELVTATGHPAELVLQALDLQTAQQATSIDHAVWPADDDGRRSVSAQLGEADQNFERTETGLTMRELLAQLPDRDRRIVELRFYGEMTQQQIADELGISQMHVSRLLRGALATLRGKLED